MTLAPPFLLLDRYDVTEEIGHGGHAIVYRAHDRLLNREVAVKLLRDDSLSTDMIARFRQEVHVTAQLEHAHILHVYDTGAYEGRPYVIMELVGGRTLADRLAREGQLPLADALAIARDVGLALAHAHARGVVHRDVKPENILLGDAGAILADFGIARVTQEILTEKITSTGTAVGTVQYMSPEQLCAEPNIDARTDQYSLACVLYEMLAGVRPHIAATFEGLRVLRMSGQHVPVRAHRPSVPEHVSEAIATALEPMPADRFRSMEEMLAHMGVGASGEFPASGSSGAGIGSGGASFSSRPSSRRGGRTEAGWWTPSRVAGALAGATVVVAVAIAVLNGNTAPTPVADGSALFAIAPDERKADTSAQGRIRSALRNELSAWSGVHVVDRARRGDTTVYAIEPSVVKIGDSVRVRVSMRRTAPGAAMPTTLERSLSAGEVASPERVAIALVPQLLLRSVAPELTEADVPGLQSVPNRSMPALRRYVRGFLALRAGELDTSAARFREAALTVPRFAHAELWAAQSVAWLRPRDPDLWRADAERAERAGTLVGADSLQAQALRALSASAYAEACDAYRSLVQEDERSFVGWFGLGECQRLDPVVGPTEQGLRFRSSHWSALSAYREAIAQVQTSELLAALFPRILNTTYAESGRLRIGQSQDGQRAYAAMPSFASDTIAFYPVDPGTFRNLPPPATWLQATRRGRAMATDLAERWISRWNESSSAWLHYALALEMAGRLGSGESGPTAEMALARASRGATTPLERAHIAVTSARVALRRGDLSAAYGISRSALKDAVIGDPRVRMALAPLAVLIGESDVALRLAVPDTERVAQVPSDLADSITSFRVRAVMGECEGLKLSRDALEKMLSAKYAELELRDRRQQLLHQAYREAAPCLGTALASELPPERTLDSVYVSLAAGNRVAALQQLRGLQARRRSVTVSTMSWDVIYAEAWALAAAGDSSGAARQLRGALSDISSMSSFTLLQTPQAGGLRQGIALARQLAKVGDAADWWSAASGTLVEPQPKKE